MTTEEVQVEAVELIERDLAGRAALVCTLLRTSPQLAQLSDVQIMDVDIHGDHANICARIHVEFPSVIFDCLAKALRMRQLLVWRYQPPIVSITEFEATRAATQHCWMIRVWFFDPPKIKQQPNLSVRLTEKLTLEFVRDSK